MSIDGGLYKLLSDHWPAWHWTRHESGAGSVGTPDVNVCARPSGVETWIELKATSGWTCPLRPAQVAWLSRRGRSGGRVLVLTRRGVAGGPRSDPCDALYVHHGASAPQLARLGLRGVTPLLRTEGGPSGWNWGGLEELLTRPLPTVERESS